ncbi:MAG: FkbM family methyltransferase [Acidaminococcus intestini]
MTYAKVHAAYPDAIVLIAFASERPEILARFFAISRQHETYAPHLPLFGDESVVSPAWLLAHETELEAVYERLADSKSRRVFCDILDYKLSGKLTYLEGVSRRWDDLLTLFSWSDRERYVDLGAYNGDTLREFLALTDGQYEHLDAVEPDPKNFKKLRIFVESQQIRKCALHQKAIWSGMTSLPLAAKGGRMSYLAQTGKTVTEGVSLDEIVGKERVTYIKMDVEGAEKEALLGGAESIHTWHPKMLIAGYHHDDDLWRLPLSIWQLVPEYRIYLRRHPYVPCWEINFFCTI